MNEFFRPGLEGQVDPKGEAMPFAYFTANPKVANLYQLDLFNVIPRTTAMRNNLLKASKQQLDTSDTKAMAKLLQEQVEFRALQNEIVHIQQL